MPGESCVCATPFLWLLSAAVYVVALVGTAGADVATGKALDPGSSGVVNRAVLQEMLSGGGIVRVDRPGRYRLSGTVYIGSHTKLVCAPGVVFVKDATEGEFSHVILNKGALTRTWDEDICVEGLAIEVNGVDHCDWQVYGLRGQLAFFCVRDLSIRRFRCNDLGRSQFGIHICTFEDVMIDDVVIRGRKDGIHLGCGRRFTITNGVFDTGDDPIALNAHDYTTSNPQVGWLEDGIVANCHDLDEDDDCVGYFCRILAGAWTAWHPEMKVQHSDAVVSGGRLYRVCMKPDGKAYVSKTQPLFADGQQTLDGIVWRMVQTNACFDAGVRNVTFRDIWLRSGRIGFSVHFDIGRYSRSYYHGAKLPLQRGLVFDNVRVLHGSSSPFMEIGTPLDSAVFTSCSFGNGGVSFTDKAMIGRGEPYGCTRLFFSDCIFGGLRESEFVSSAIDGKKVEVVK